MKCSIEILYHLSCNHCNKWFSIADHCHTVSTVDRLSNGEGKEVEGVAWVPVVNVDHPKHYQQVSTIGRPILVALGVSPELLEVECLEAIEILEKDGGWSFSLLNAVKYLWRCGLKGDANEDLRKASWYLNQWLESATWTAPQRQGYVLEAIRLIDQLTKPILPIVGTIASDR
ncbi:MAG: DUF3310 domain-containing protein [Microcoleus sp.]